MALEFLKNLFGSKSDKAKMTHIKALVATALADGKIDDAEKALLAMVVKREGITEKEFTEALNGKKSEYKIPEDMATRERYLRDMVAMMVVDGKISEEELKVCFLAAKSFGFSLEQAKEIIAQVAASALASGYDADKMFSELR